MPDLQLTSCYPVPPFPYLEIEGGNSNPPHRVIGEDLQIPNLCLIHSLVESININCVFVYLCVWVLKTEPRAFLLSYFPSHIITIIVVVIIIIVETESC